MFNPGKTQSPRIPRIWITNIPALRVLDPGTQLAGSLELAGPTTSRSLLNMFRLDVEVLNPRRLSFERRVNTALSGYLGCNLSNSNVP